MKTQQKPRYTSTPTYKTFSWSNSVNKKSNKKAIKASKLQAMVKNGWKLPNKQNL